MENKTGNTRTGGVGFVGLLQILFIGLKLTGYIDWPWVWVLSPMLISIGLATTIVLAAIAFVAFSRG